LYLNKVNLIITIKYLLFLRASLSYMTCSNEFFYKIYVVDLTLVKTHTSEML